MAKNFSESFFDFVNGGQVIFETYAVAGGKEENSIKSPAFVKMRNKKVPLGILLIRISFFSQDQ